LDFTTQKIQENFSNFSAFFYRSQLLVPLSLLTATTTNEEASASSAVINWEDELQLIENAVCTEPDDQTAWWYQALLFSMDQFPVVDLKARLLQQADLLRELLQDSPNSKWIWMGLHRILQAVAENIDEQCLCLVQLQDIDPDRQQRYQELLEATTNGGTAANPLATGISS
jgi:geranylgeranyl transferase type-2 subunit alpha